MRILIFLICIFGPMEETKPIQKTNIYLAPLQGFTDHVYRRSYHEVFNQIDKWFIPYISLKNGGILKKYEREILPENNPGEYVIPQVLVNNPEEIISLSKILENHGYKEINLNLGCT